MDWFLNLPLAWQILSVYLVLISILSVIVCIYDKVAAKIVARNGKVGLRIPEKSLLVWSALGGGVAMFITMLIIRHKTNLNKHPQFMIGIPVIILVQAALIAALIHFGILPL